MNAATADLGGGPLMSFKSVIAGTAMGLGLGSLAGAQTLNTYGMPGLIEMPSALALPDATIATSILHLCHELGMRTCAEGVETAEQAEILVSHGCLRLQGFGIAKPMSFEEALTFGERRDIALPHAATLKSA